MNEACYWCGNKATGKEHVPPRNLFPKKQRKELVTVPACEFHNSAFSKLDERWRFLLQAGSDTQQAFEEFDATTMRSLQRREAQKFVKSLVAGSETVVIPMGKSQLLSFDPSDAQKYFEKIARGLFWHHNKTPFGEGICISVMKQSFAVLPDVLAYFERVAPLFRNPAICREGKTANADIFRYRYIDVSQKGHRAFAIAMHFYRSVTVISTLSTKSD